MECGTSRGSRARAFPGTFTSTTTSTVRSFRSWRSVAMSRGGTTTAELEVITPLRIESLAFGGADTVIGAGRDKAQKSGAKLAARLNEHTGVALVGVAGGG